MRRDQRGNTSRYYDGTVHQHRSHAHRGKRRRWWLLWLA